MELFFVWAILSVLVGVWASGRGHNGFGMFLVSFLLSPLIGLLIEAIRGKDFVAAEQAALATGAMKTCPACAELVRSEAKKCRYCGELLAVPARPVSDNADESNRGPTAFGG